ncbi:MAG: phosphoheptose isomerase [candidate division Zixibacteria bacterium CG_4_9_14_3_um_filter_46_8]|nr:MAG: phosphoheptose isomerase [candidate division Zixibacteria bacterium CG_4_9_14_3_um_filter_46_8]
MRKEMKFSDYMGTANDVLNKMDTMVINKVIDVLYKGYVDSKMVFFAGNGGSAAAASHICEDLSKGTQSNMTATKRFRALSLVDNVPYITAMSNDEGYEHIFEQQLICYARPGDILVCISGSGNSQNVVRAMEWAKKQDLTTIAFSGYNGGKIGTIADINLHVPTFDMGLAEGLHIFIAHFITDRLREKIRNEG